MAFALIATFAVFIALGVAGAVACQRLRQPTSRRIAFGFGVLLALPCVIFAVYYLHWWHEPVLLYRFRALPGSELAAGLCGMVAGWCGWRMARDQRRWVRLAIPMLMILPTLIVVPYLKFLLSPLDLDQLKDRWSDDVCLQTSSSTCGPGSAATILRSLGHETSERALAEAARTTASGTECWYLVRAMRGAGLTVDLVETAPNPPRMPWPTIAGTRLGRDGAGHFVTVLGEGARGGYVIGDPLRGRRDLDPGELRRSYWFTGFFITVDNHPR